MADTEALELEWNGKDLPRRLASLPPGRYRIEPAEPWDLSPEEDEQLKEAAAALDRGEGIPAETVAEELRLRIAARKS